ncbi:MAG: arsenical pump-driving ATPase [Alphaproteobacteria bacterium]
MSFLKRPTPTIFFTGKGGVGKTSTSCAAAVRFARAGKQVLLVSTDPASNLEEVFEARIGTEPTAITAVPGLFALNVDPEAAAAAYREKLVGPYRGVLPEAAVAAMEEQMAGACTVEIAAFNEFARLIGDPKPLEKFDHVIFDTAPTGHTLRLLSLPTAWTGFIENANAGTSCIGPLQGLIEERALYAAAMAALSDSARTTVVLVSRPERSAIDEAARTAAEFIELNITNQELVLNGVFEAQDRTDGVAVALEAHGIEAMAEIPAQLANLERIEIPLRPRQVVGLTALEGFFAAETGRPETVSSANPPDTPDMSGWESLDTLIDSLDQSGGVIMTMGKGGVGKTTIAATIARELAARGHDVLLTTTDPAAHVAEAVGEAPPNLRVERIDPEAEVERYRADVLASTGKNLDADGLALLQEDLASPCTEEIAVFQAFAATVNQAKDRIVVMDTAPTGHTILLLDAAQSYHREVSRQAKAVPQAVLNLLPRLRDPAFTRILLCTLPEATPVHEAGQLQDDLRRAEIEPFAWVVNQSLAPISVTDPVLVARRAQESRYLKEVRDELANRTAIIELRLQSESGQQLPRLSA